MFSPRAGPDAPEFLSGWIPFRDDYPHLYGVRVSATASPSARATAGFTVCL